MNYDHGYEDSNNSESNERTQNSLSSTPINNSNSPNAGSTSDQTIQCAMCEKSFLRSQSNNMPFCSQRCQQIDMGRWLNEEYGFPSEGEGVAEGFEDSDEEQDRDL